MAAVGSLDLEVDIRPPSPPWLPLKLAEPAVGCLCVFLSDDLSRLPVRAVTRAADNKSDPNLETGTFGLFSTCEPQMRSSAVNRGLRWLFFVTRHGGRRVLCGCYRLRWFTDGVLHAGKSDYALAADGTRFIDPPLPLDELPPVVREVATSWFRNFRLLDEGQTQAVARLLDSKPNGVKRYLDEIDRLERFNQTHTGYRHWNDSLPFSWESAKRYLKPMASIAGEASTNTSPTNHWLCRVCDTLIMNKSLLKECPACQSMASLRPVTPKELRARERG